MKGWLSYLIWEGIPLLLILSLFGFIAVVNWDFEKKLVTVRSDAPDTVSAYMGPIMLGSAIGMALIASSFLFIIRLSTPKWVVTWAHIVSLILIAIFLILPSLFLIILGPAAITMIEQMSQVPK